MKKPRVAKTETGERKRSPSLLARAPLNDAMWRNAIREWEESRPEALTRLLAGRSAIPAHARAWLAQLAEGKAKKRRGRRAEPFSLQRLVGTTLQNTELRQEYRRRVSLEKMGEGLGTPSERVLEAMAEERGTTPDALSQVIYPRRRKVDK